MSAPPEIIEAYREGMRKYRSKAHGDRIRAFDCFTKCAVYGCPEGQLHLALLYEFGIGITESHDMAMRRYARAAGQGYAEAMFGIGNMHRNGRGAEQDYAIAYGWFRKAADPGLAKARCAVGLARHSGKGADKPDDLEAMKWFRPAAARGRRRGIGMAGMLSRRAKAIRTLERPSEGFHGIRPGVS